MFLNNRQLIGSCSYSLVLARDLKKLKVITTILQVIDIVSHPDFKAEAGVEGCKDIAVFKVDEASLEDISTKDAN